jgi:hypothetical protein
MRIVRPRMIIWGAGQEARNNNAKKPPLSGFSFFASFAGGVKRQAVNILLFCVDLPSSVDLHCYMPVFAQICEIFLWHGYRRPTSKPAFRNSTGMPFSPTRWPAPITTK